MPAATTKAELLETTQKEFAKLSKLLEGVSKATTVLPHDDTTIKDLIAHRAHWTRLFFGWYATGQRGEHVHFPAEGYKWNALKDYNAMLREKYANKSWEDVQEMLDQSYEQLCTFIEEHSQSALYDDPMKGANNNWTTGRWAEAAGASHYRSAAKYVRSVLRATK